MRFTKKDIERFLRGDYFEVYKAQEDEILVLSKNTEDFWDLTIFQDKIEFRHKHKLNHVYHRDNWYAKNLEDARTRIIKHDLYVLNGRKPIDAELLNHIIKFYD